MAKLLKLSDGAMAFWCPGCKENHSFYANPDRSPNGSSWNWNFSFDAPTFRPSLLVKHVFTDPSKPDKFCHSYVTDGKIEYLQDSYHSLAGQTIEMEEVENG